MKFSEYKAVIKERLEAYFSFLPDNSHLGKKYELAAVFSSRQVQTAIFKENVMDYLDSKEFLLLSNLENPQSLNSELKALADIALFSAEPSRHHKSTAITRVFVCEQEVSKETIKAIKKYKFSKAFRCLLWGWAEVRVLLIDLSNNKVYSNWAAHNQKKVFTVKKINSKSL